MWNVLNHHVFIKCLLSAFNTQGSVSIWFHGGSLEGLSSSPLCSGEVTCHQDAKWDLSTILWLNCPGTVCALSLVLVREQQEVQWSELRLLYSHICHYRERRHQVVQAQSGSLQNNGESAKKLQALSPDLSLEHYRVFGSLPLPLSSNLPSLSVFLLLFKESSRISHSVLPPVKSRFSHSQLSCFLLNGTPFVQSSDGLARVKNYCILI